jgi:hypothetical protein
LCPDWDTAVGEALAVGLYREVRDLQVGASMFARMPPGAVPTPRPAGGTETRPGLALLRDLAASGLLVHDSAGAELEEAVSAARVKEGAAGLVLMKSGTSHLVRALVWAVAAAHKPSPVPAIY